MPEIREKDVCSNMSNMNWNDLEYLLNKGHTIGAHTANHARLSQISEKNLESEIVDSAELIEKRLGINVKHFAYTYGNLKSFSPKA